MSVDGPLDFLEQIKCCQHDGNKYFYNKISFIVKDPFINIELICLMEDITSVVRCTSNFYFLLKK